MNTTHKTGTIRTVAVAFLVAVVVVLSLGTVTTDVKAGTKQTSVANKTLRQREMCEEIGGGKLVVVDGPAGSGSNTTECKGGTGDGDYCFNTPNSVECHPGDHDPSNASGSGYGQDDLWQDVKGNEQTATSDSIAGGDFPPSLTAETPSLDSDPAAIPPIDTAVGSGDDQVVADPAPTTVQDGKNGTNGTVAERTQSQREACETIGGGKLAVQESTDGTSNTTQCKGGAQDGWTCYNTPSETKCHKAFTQPEEDPRLAEGELAGAEVISDSDSLPEVHTTESVQPQLVEEPLVDEGPATDYASDSHTLASDEAPIFEAVDEQE